MIEQDRNLIQKTAQKFSEVIGQMAGEDAAVGVFYIFLDPKTKEWVSGDAGNMNWIERVGATQFLNQAELDAPNRKP